MPYEIVRPQDLISPQSRAVTYGLQPYVEERLIKQLPALQQYKERESYLDYLNKQDALQNEAYRTARRQGIVNLAGTGVRTAIEAAPVLKKYGPNVLKAITKPLQTAQPVTDVADDGTGLFTTGGAATPEIGLDATETAVRGGAPEGGSLFTSTTGPGSVQNWTELEGIKAGAANFGLGLAANTAIDKWGVGKGISEKWMGRKFGGAKEWDIAAKALTGFAFGGPVGMGISLLGSLFW